MAWDVSLCNWIGHSHTLVMPFDVMMMLTNHRMMHDIALRCPLRYIQGPCYNVHVIIAPCQGLDKALKACPVVSALQASKLQLRPFL